MCAAFLWHKEAHVLTSFSLQDSSVAQASKPKHAVIRPPPSDLAPKPAPSIQLQKPKVEETEEGIHLVSIHLHT